MINILDNGIPVIQRIDTPEGRRYQTPEGLLYPSVTAITSHIGEDHITEWIEKVGKETAEKISRKAAARGSLIHENVENYCRGLPLKFDMFQAEEESMFKNLLPVLADISDAYCIETALWSDNLKVAGTVDMIAHYKGELMVIDWKTSGRYKHASEIQNYFAQCAAYAYMFYERTGIPIKNLLIAMTTQDDGILLFKERVRDHLPQFINARQIHLEKFNE